MGAEFLLHVGMKRMHVGQRVQAARHAGLVGHDHEGITRLQQALQRLHGTGQPVEVFAAHDITEVFVEHTVAVQESGRAQRHVGVLPCAMRCTSAVVE